MFEWYDIALSFMNFVEVAEFNTYDNEPKAYRFEFDLRFNEKKYITTMLISCDHHDVV